MTEDTLPPEDELVERLKNNDVVLFERVVKEYHSAMFGVAYSIAGPAIADEVVQEAWVSAINAIHKFEGRSALK